MSHHSHFFQVHSQSTNAHKPASYTLELTLPSTYPSTSKPTAYLNCGDTVSTVRRKESRAALSEIVSSQPLDLEILDQITSSLLDLVPTFLQPSRPSSIKDGVEGNMNTTTTEEKTTLSDHQQQQQQHQQSSQQQNPQKVKQVVIWSHHLLATSKRRAIQSWSKELSLRGYARPGYPGAIFAEGETDQVDEFVRRLKALRWQALQVRAEDVVEERVLDLGSGEGIVECESLGEIAESLKERDGELGAMFLEGMKISH